MVVAILICLWIWDELSYNHYHHNYKRIAVCMSVETINGGTTAEPFASVSLAGALRTSFQRNFKYISLVKQTGQILKCGEKTIAQSEIESGLGGGRRAGERGV